MLHGGVLCDRELLLNKMLRRVLIGKKIKRNRIDIGAVVYCVYANL